MHSVERRTASTAQRRQHTCTCHASRRIESAALHRGPWLPGCLLATKPAPVFPALSICRVPSGRDRVVPLTPSTRTRCRVTILFLFMHNVNADSTTPANRDATSTRIPRRTRHFQGTIRRSGWPARRTYSSSHAPRPNPQKFQGHAGSPMAADKAMTSTFGDGPRDLCSGLKIPALHDDHDRPSGLAVEPGLPGIAFSGLLPANCRAAGGRVSASLGMPRLIGVCGQTDCHSGCRLAVVSPWPAQLPCCV